MSRSKKQHDMGETFFLNIRKGDTPKTNSFSKHAVLLCDMVLDAEKPKKVSRKK